MEEIIQYFEHIPSAHRSAILVGGLAFFTLLETGIPKVKQPYNKWKHAGINIFFTLTTVVVNFVLAFMLLWASDWAVSHHFGLLQWLPALPLWAYMLVGLLSMDLISAYFAHWTEHNVKWMWMFHLVHHTDQYVDTTTANRHHPGESVIRFTFTALGALLTGANWWVVMLYQSLSVVLSQFNHANIRLPEGIDRILSLVIVTPGMHRIHHHYQQPFTDSNYGNIFAIWDHLFGTFRRMPSEQLVFGVDTYMEEPEHSHLPTLLGIPFGPYRAPDPNP